MKKTISLLLILALMFSCMSVFASADGLDLDESRAVSPRYKKLSNCWAGLASTGSGWYDVTGGAGSVYNNITISVTVILQRFNAKSTTGWDDLVTMTDSERYSASCGTSYYISTPGTYRTHTIAMVYDDNGTFIESELANSDHLILK